MKKRCGTADLKEGMLVSCPHFQNSPRVVVGPAYSLATNDWKSSAPMYRIRLADPMTGQAQNFDFPDPANTSFWTIHDDDVAGDVEKKTHPGFEPCNTYGCMEPKVKGQILCPSCEEDYQRDPDAYK